MSEISKCQPVSMTAQELAALIETGQATEAQKGMALRAVQVAIAANMTGNLSVLSATLQGAVGLYVDMERRYQQLLSEEVHNMSRQELAQEVNRFERRMMRLIDMQRQIIQGKTIFPDNSLSDDDKKVMQLLVSVKNPDQRNALVKLINTVLGEDIEPADEV